MVEKNSSETSASGTGVEKCKPTELEKKVASSWNSDGDKYMGNLAKSLAKNEKTLSNADVTVMIVKNKYQNNNQSYDATLHCKCIPSHSS